MLPINNRNKLSLGLKTFIPMVLVGLTLIPAASPSVGQGFICGAMAFCFSATSLDRLARMILHHESLAQGVQGGVFWLAFKFLGPAGVIFLGLWKGFSPLSLVTGIIASLIVFAGLLLNKKT